MKALIIGGGIGGLAAAIALRHARVEVVVCERADEFREVGAGLLLAPNAVRALERLGLRAPVEAAAVPIERAEIRTRRGHLLAAFPSGEISKRVGAPTVCLHRAELLALLAGALQPGTLRLSRQCVRVAQTPEGITAWFADGQEERRDFVIGADGLHSVVRERVLGRTPLRYAGYTAWRGIAAMERTGAAARTSCESWGRGSRFGFVPLDLKRVYWFATMNAPEGGDDPDRKRALLERFAGWHDPIPSLLAATDAAAILRNDVYDRDPAVRWGEGRITLLGDAAHPTTPNLGQGACQALEDAVVLARWLRREHDVTAALRGYETDRMPRTRRIVEQSRRLGAMGQWEQPWACWLRDHLTRIMSAHLLARQTERITGWILDYEP